MPHNILVTGATGNQGGAVLHALFDLNETSIQVYALTRDANSPRAQKLAAQYPRIHVISGTFDSPSAIFTACSHPIDAVFAIQAPVGFPPNANIEEQHGKDFVNAAIANGVKHFVQTTVDRGPDSDTNLTKVPHFISKFHIEQHLKHRASESDGRLTYTILRPTVFMENFDAGFMTKIMATSLRDGLPSSQKVQMIAAKDIGWFGAQALTQASPSAYRNQSISLAGDWLTYGEIASVYQEVAGTPLPTTWGVVNSAVGLMVKELPLTLQCFVEDGFSADIATLRQLNPGLRTFRMWMEERKVKAAA